MHRLLFLPLEFMFFLLTCVYTAPSLHFSSSAGADQYTAATTEKALPHFVSRAVPSNLTGVKNNTPASKSIPLASSSNEHDDPPSCFKPRPQPSSFRCTEALHEFLRSFDHSQTYLVERFRIPIPFSDPSYIVPKNFVAGTCRLTIDLDHFFYAPTVTGRELKAWGTWLVEDCVKDERYSGGGLIERVFGNSALFISIGSTVNDAEGLAANNTTTRANDF